MYILYLRNKKTASPTRATKIKLPMTAPATTPPLLGGSVTAGLIRGAAATNSYIWKRSHIEVNIYISAQLHDLSLWCVLPRADLSICSSPKFTMFLIYLQTKIFSISCILQHYHSLSPSRLFTTS